MTIIDSVIVVDFPSNVRSIKTMAVHQYDHGLKLRIRGLSEFPQAHFANKNTRTALNVLTSYDQGDVLVDIPDSLLLCDENILCYLYVEDEESGFTTREIIIPMIPRAKPAEVVFSSEEQLEPINQLHVEQSKAISEVDAVLERAEAIESDAAGYAADAQEAKEAIENMTVTAHKTGGDVPTVDKTIVDGVVQLDFGLVSSSFKIKGEAYQTLEELDAAVTEPEIGDMYNVGTEAPYNVYRWTGTSWEDQGVLQGIQGFSPTVDVVKEGKTTTITFVDIDGTETAVIQDGESVSVNGVEPTDGNIQLTAQEVTVSQDDQRTVYEALEDKVDAVDGMGLSSNDFTDELLEKLTNLTVGDDGVEITIDSELSDTSTNPVQNKVITEALNTHTHDRAGSAAKLETAVLIDGVSFDGAANVSHYAVCNTASEVTEKTVDLERFVLDAGARVIVKFAADNTASAATLNVNNTGAKAITYRGITVEPGLIVANRVYEFVYDGNSYMLVWGVDTKIEVANDLTTTTEGYVQDARQGAILEDKKVDKVEGKGLSTNDLTDELVQKISEVAEHTHEEFEWLDQDVKTTSSPNFDVVTANKVIGAVYM